jgi:hypothetical protein
MTRPFTRARTQVLFQYMPGAVFNHTTYGLCRVSSVDLDPNVEVNAGTLFEAVSEYLGHWEAEMRTAFPDASPAGANRLFQIGSPSRVRFQPYPDLFQCAGCGQVHSLRSLRRGRRIVNHGSCPSCGRRLHQIRYVEAHNCGRVETLFLPSCDRHGGDAVTFEDTGRFRTAVWRCRACHGRVLQGTRQRPCNCTYGRQNPADRRMKGYVVTDPGLYQVHTLPFLNLSPAEVDEILNDPDGRLLALARACGVLREPVSATVAKRAAVGTETQTELARFVERLRETGIPEDLLQTQLNAIRPTGGNTQEIITSVANAFGTEIEVLRGRIPRRVVEHAAIIDAPGSKDLAEVQRELDAVGDLEGSGAIREAVRSSQQMGLSNLRALSDFPIALCAVGYTRVTRSPQQSEINTFPSTSEDSRIPLYVLTNTTEAIYFQLDPLRVLDWINRNAIAHTPAADTALEAWAIIHARVPGLLRTRNEPEYIAPASVAVRTLLHSISHALLKNVEWSGYDPASVGEFLFPETLSCVLYANRYQETKVGGLLTLFERGLAMWLQRSRDDARACLYDPICEDEGGACSGCLQREHGCTEFNQELSRATLFGGPLPLSPVAEGVFEIERGYWDYQ